MNDPKVVREKSSFKVFFLNKKNQQGLHKVLADQYLTTNSSSDCTNSVMVGRSWCSCAHMRSRRSTNSGHHCFRRPTVEGLNNNQ